jgi:hypothetical protein
MSQMFLDALTGFTQGAQQAGAVMAQGQAQQVDAAWKNRALAMQDEKLGMERTRLSDSLLSSEQARSIAKGQDDRASFWDTEKKNLYQSPEAKAAREAGLISQKWAAVEKYPIYEKLKAYDPDFVASHDNLKSVMGKIERNKIIASELAGTTGARTSSSLVGGTSTTTSGGADTLKQDKFIMDSAESLAKLYGEVLSVVPQSAQTMDGFVKTTNIMAQRLNSAIDPTLSPADRTAAISSGRAELLVYNDWLNTMLEQDKKQDESITAAMTGKQEIPIGIRAPEPEVVTQDPNIVSPPNPGEQGYEEFIANRPKAMTFDFDPDSIQAPQPVRQLTLQEQVRESQRSLGKPDTLNRSEGWDFARQLADMPARGKGNRISELKQAYAKKFGVSAVSKDELIRFVEDFKSK